MTHTRSLVARLLFAFFVAAVIPEASAGELILVAGGGTGGDGATAKRAALIAPFGVGFDAGGTLFFVEMTGHRVRKISRDGLVKSVAGTGSVGNGGDGGPAIDATLNGPHSLAVAKSGEIFVADTWNNRVRKIDRAVRRDHELCGDRAEGFRRRWWSGAGGGIRRNLLLGARRGKPINVLGGPRQSPNQKDRHEDRDCLDRRRQRQERRTRRRSGCNLGALGRSPSGGRRYAVGTSISWSAQGTPFGSSIDPGRFARWPVPASPVTQVMVATRCERG